MVARKPLVMVDGRPSLLAAGDTVDGLSVPTGGTTGQVVAKLSGTDYDTGWQTPFFGSQALLRQNAGGFISNSLNAATLSTAVQVVDRVTIAPFVPARSMTIDQLGCSISVVVVSTTVKLVVYESDANGRPSAVLVETGTIDSATTTGTKFASISPLTLDAGKIYWMGLRSSGTPTVRTCGAAGALLLSSGNGATPQLQISLTKTEAYADAAATWSYSNSQLSTLAPPLIVMRVA